MPRTYFANTATALMVVCAVAVTGVTVRREFVTPPGRTGSRAPTVVKDWSRYSLGGHAIGDTNAAVTLVEFADFECPFCRRLALDVDSLRRLGTRIRTVYRHFPVPSHRFALMAVRASECASDQHGFESMHSALFAHPESLGVAAWWWFARSAGLKDSAAFESCVKRRGPLPVLDQDTTDARRLGLHGTPLLLIEDTRVDGAPPFDSLRAYINRAAARHKAS